MTREELKQKYPTEKIFVLKTNDTILHEGFKKYDYITGQQYLNYVQYQGFFINRYDAEFNPKFKQIIPYCIIKSGNTGAIFMTQRIKGDSRLVGRTSIGQGGHINPIDGNNNEIIIDAIKRELKEELGIIDSDIAEIILKGTLYDSTNSVGKDHLGLIFQITVINDNINVKETDTLKGQWAFINTLEKHYENMENWSKIVFDNVVKA